MSRVQSIERAFAVLEALTDGASGVTEVADRTDLPKSTVARLLASLMREGVVEQVPGGRAYRLGDRMTTLAGGVSSTRRLVALARPDLVELASAVGEAAGLSIPDGRVVHYIDQVDTAHQVQVRDWTGTRVPMHAVSSGQVFLAHLPPDRLDTALAEPREPFTPATLTDPAALRERVRQVRATGYAWVREEFAEGLVSIAAPVTDASGEVVAAVHVHGPSYRFPPADGDDAIVEALRWAAARISARLRPA